MVTKEKKKIAGKGGRFAYCLGLFFVTFFVVFEILTIRHVSVKYIKYKK